MRITCPRCERVYDDERRVATCPHVQPLLAQRADPYERFEAYEVRAMGTAVYPKSHSDLPIYPALKLCGEAGEVAEKIGKCIRDAGSKLSDEARHDLLLELGDVLWYVTAISRDLGSSLNEIAHLNLSKLSSRAARGKIKGEGDHR